MLPKEEANYLVWGVLLSIRAAQRLRSEWLGAGLVG